MGYGYGADAIPDRALPRFGKGAFRGFIAPAVHTRGDASFSTTRIVQPAPQRVFSGFVPQVTPTQASAGNRVRLGTVGILSEYWRWRRPLWGEYFVRANPQSSAVARRSRPQPVLSKLIPSSHNAYDPPQYQGRPADPAPHPKAGALRSRGTAFPRFGVTAGARAASSGRGGRFA